MKIFCKVEGKKEPVLVPWIHAIVGNTYKNMVVVDAPSAHDGYYMRKPV